MESVACTLGEKEGTGQRMHKVMLGCPGLDWERMLPFLDYIWKKAYCLFKGKTLQAPAKVFNWQGIEVYAYNG